jgi:hypothetical protein
MNMKTPCLSPFQEDDLCILTESFQYTPHVRWDKIVPSISSAIYIYIYIYIYISVIGCNISPHARGDKIDPSISSAEDDGSWKHVHDYVVRF